MNAKLLTTLLGFNILMLTACGGVPLAQPEGPTAQATEEILVVQPESPLAPPTATVATKPEEVSIPSTSSFVNVVSDQPLTFDDTSPEGAELRTQIDSAALSTEAGDRLVLLGWTDKNEIVIRPGVEGNPPPGKLPTPTPGPETQYAISPDTGKVRSAPEWSRQPAWTETQWQMRSKIETNLPENSERDGLPVPIQWYPSPDGQHLAVSFLNSNLYIYRDGTNKPIAILPPGNLKYDFKLAGQRAVWSTEGNRLAYSVATTDPAAYEDYPTANLLQPVYQVHISDATGRNLSQLDLPWPSSPNRVLNWSPDDRYLAVIAQIEPQEPGHLLIARLEDRIWNDVIPDINASSLGKLFWSPNGNMVAYGYVPQNGFIRVMKLDSVP